MEKNATISTNKQKQIEWNKITQNINGRLTGCNQGNWSIPKFKRVFCFNDFPFVMQLREQHWPSPYFCCTLIYLHKLCVRGSKAKMPQSLFTNCIYR